MVGVLRVPALAAVAIVAGETTILVTVAIVRSTRTVATIVFIAAGEAAPFAPSLGPAASRSLGVALRISIPTASVIIVAATRVAPVIVVVTAALAAIAVVVTREAAAFIPAGARLSGHVFLLAPG